MNKGFVNWLVFYGGLAPGISSRGRQNVSQSFAARE